MSTEFDQHIDMINLYSAGIDFSRQNLTSVDVRFWQILSLHFKIQSRL